MANEIINTNKKDLSIFLTILVLTILSVLLFNNVFPSSDMTQQAESTKAFEEYATLSNKVYATEGNVYANDFKNEILKVFKTSDGYDLTNYDKLRSSLLTDDTLKFKPSTYSCFYNNLLLIKDIYKCFMITKGITANLDDRFEMDTKSTGSAVTSALNTIDSNKREGMELVAAAVRRKVVKFPTPPNRGAPATNGTAGSR